MIRSLISTLSAVSSTTYPRSARLRCSPLGSRGGYLGISARRCMVSSNLFLWSRHTSVRTGQSSAQPSRVTQLGWGSGLQLTRLQIYITSGYAVNVWSVLTHRRPASSSEGRPRNLCATSKHSAAGTGLGYGCNHSLRCCIRRLLYYHSVRAVG